MRGRRKAHLCFPVTSSNLSWELHRPQQRTHTEHPLPRKKSAKRPPPRASTVPQRRLHTHCPAGNGHPIHLPLARSFIGKTRLACYSSFPLLPSACLSGPADPRAANPHGPELLLKMHSPDFILEFLPLPWNQKIPHRRCGPDLSALLSQLF